MRPCRHRARSWRDPKRLCGVGSSVTPSSSRRGRSKAHKMVIPIDRGPRDWRAKRPTGSVMIEAALTHGLKAVEWAETPEDERAALWGAFLGALAQSSEEAEALLHSLSERAGSDVDSALRVAIGRVVHASHQGSLRGAWLLLEPLLPLAEDHKGSGCRRKFLSSMRHRAHHGRRVRTRSGSGGRWRWKGSRSSASSSLFLSACSGRASRDRSRATRAGEGVCGASPQPCRSTHTRK